MRYGSVQTCVAIIGLSLLVCSTGCRNNGYGVYPPCNSVCNGLGWGAPTTVAAPPTYSLNIPSAAQQQYYNRGSATADAGGLLQSGGNAPTGGSLAPQDKWREAGAAESPTTSLNRTQNSQSRSVLASNSTAGGLTRVASTGNTGLSFRDNQNYATTNIDERFDRSRLPATDATQVRAPVRQPTVVAQNIYGVAPATYQNQVPQAPVVIQDPRYAAAPTYYGTPVIVGPPNNNGTLVAGNVIPGRVEYSAASPTFSRPAGQTYPGITSSAPTVLAESTVYSDPNRATTTTASGWRSSDLNQLNR